jgi:hypothetical protein
MDVQTSNALSLLRNEEPCIVMTKEGRKRSAAWLRPLHKFWYKDEPQGLADSSEIEEWWPTAFMR